MRERKLLVYCIQNGHKGKHNKVTLKTKYEALKELDKNRPNKKVVIQFNVPGSTRATWKKCKEKTYQAFQNSSLKRQSVKVGTYETVCSQKIQVLII